MPKAQNTTILSFFSPKSKTVATGNKDKENRPLGTKSSHIQSPQNVENKSDFVPGDVVWSKLDGYPWWPSIVCIEQAFGKHYKIDRKKVFVHVQFFDVPITRGWILERQMERYNGSKSSDVKVGGKFFSSANNPDVQLSMQKADSAMKLSLKEKMELIIDQSKFEDKDMEVEENNVVKFSRKRRRIIEESEESVDDSGDDYKPEISKEESEEDFTDVSEHSASEASEPEDSPVKGTKKRKMSCNNSSLKNSPPHSTTKLTNKSLSYTPNVSSKTKSRLSLFESESFASKAEDSVSSTKYFHETLSFLFPNNIMDKENRRPDHADYDKNSLYIPRDFFTKLTPAMYQWWKIKEDNFNTILFFKVGKFYELYHMDAAVGVKELGLIFMKGEFAHSGFPEISFGRYSDALVQRGYKVARVEQTETPEQNAKRIRGKTLQKHEKTLRREICRIISPGTQTLDSWSAMGTMTNNSNYLLSITEKIKHDSENKSVQVFGVCFIDTSLGMFHIGQFMDDRHLSHLCTMLAHYTPCQVLYEKGKVSQLFCKILKSGLSSAVQEPLLSGSQFWDAEKTLKNISQGKYFVKDGAEEWPETLKKMLSDTDTLGLTPSTEYELALSALGGCIYYLRKCLIDYEVLSMKQFTEFIPLQYGESSINKHSSPSQLLILDSVSLNNLEILNNSSGEAEGSLINRLDNCSTPFGKRLIRQWICSPSCNVENINHRLDAIEDLRSNHDFVDASISVLKKMPDIERLLMKIHSLSKGAKQENHPDTRAVLYEEVKYSKKKIEDFLSILGSYESYFSFLMKNQNVVLNFRSELLQQTCGLECENNRGKFPDLGQVLNTWKKAFNHKMAKENGKIIPNKGTNPEYDEAMEDISRIKSNLDDYLAEQRKKLKSSKIVYKGAGNKRFQLEMPEEVVNRSSLKGYIISGQRKGYKSFRTDDTAGFLREMEDAEARRDSAQTETMAIVFREFDKDYDLWKRAIQCISVLDVLISLTLYCNTCDGDICRPVFIEESDKPFIEIQSGRHPCVTKTFFGDDFIPNDTFLGCSIDGDKDSSCMILTGPNMGGKSTLMRQVGLIAVVAHLGCYVPAEICRLTPVDRIFTRLGASDKIMSGESTFFVELSETASILKHATKHSLVLLDELGRGTATYDGTAIASAVVQEIAEHIKCRTIFSTHYHSLVDGFKHNSSVKLGHMSCMVENEDIDDDNPSKENLTFLYKLAEGACPKSYGFHAARLADVPDNVIRVARQKSREMEFKNNQLKMFNSVFSLS